MRSTILLVSLMLVLPDLSAETPGAANRDADTLTFGHGAKPWLVYNAGYIDSPDPKTPWFGRSGFLHPIRTPQGQVVTAGFPVDHMHQHGIMFAWTSSQYNDHPVDFWNSAARQGRVEHVETIQANQEKLAVRLRHIDTTVETPLEVLHETWEITHVPHDSMNVFDLVSRQTCATDQPLTIQQYHYGALCVRGPVQWLENQATMRTSQGLSRKEGNHSRPSWVAMHGQIDGQTCGIAAMSHPSNFRSPQPARLHPSKPYFCFAPMVLGDFQIEPGQPYVSRFRFAVFDGPIDENQLQQVWQQYSDH